MEKIIKHRKTAIITLIVVVVISLIAWSARGNGNGETIIVDRGDLTKTVELSGKVTPRDEVDLSFEIGGTVSWVNKKIGSNVYIGNVLVQLDQSKTQADLAKAEADLMAARAELVKLEGSGGTSAKVVNLKNSLVQDILKAYTDADDAIHNKVDQFFTNGSSRNPEIINSFDDDYNLRTKIDNNRIYIEDVLISWKKDISNLNTSSYTGANLKLAQDSLKEISSFLNDVSTAVNKFEVNSSLTQTTIDKYKTDLATARQNINTALTTLISGETDFSGTLSDVSVELAKVSAAEATVKNYRSTLSKMTLVSPISGIISKQDAKVGEAISANTAIVSIMSLEYKIEAYVPEVSFAGVDVGDKAKITLDAYGDSVEFTGLITHIDPRETIRDGVSTYKIELELSKPDSRVRSGMTANIHIESERKTGVLILPLRAILKNDGQNIVLIKDNDGQKVERKIEIGATDSSGNVEIVSGLSENDIVFLNPTK